MGQVITNAFEQYWQSSLAAEQPVVLDEFVLADIPNLDITAPIDPDTGLPPAGQIVHRQTVDQRGRVNNNAVAYSIVMDTTVGDFSFNAMFLRNKANGVIGMIVYKGRETKLKTDQTTGQTGNSLVKSMLMGYDQAAEATLTHVDAGTWQIDYAARLHGQDEDLRQLASQLYGHHTFIGDGFKVVQQDGGHQVTPGVAIVGGLRIELKQPEVVYPGTKPIGVWVDVHRSGSLLSEHQNHFTLITSVADLTDHLDSNGFQHYVAKLGTVQADNSVVDGRGQGGSSTEYRKELAEPGGGNIPGWYDATAGVRASNNKAESNAWQDAVNAARAISGADHPVVIGADATGVETVPIQYANPSGVSGFHLSQGSLAAPSLDKRPIILLEKVCDSGSSSAPHTMANFSMSYVGGVKGAIPLSSYVEAKGTAAGGAIGFQSRAKLMNAAASGWGGWSYIDVAGTLPLRAIGHEINVRCNLPSPLTWSASGGEVDGLVIATVDNGANNMAHSAIKVSKSSQGLGFLTGLRFGYRSIIPCDDTDLSVLNGEAILINGGSISTERYGGIRIGANDGFGFTKFHYGLRTNEAQFNNNVAIWLGDNQRIRWGTSLSSGAYLHYNALDFEAVGAALNIANGSGSALKINGNKVLGLKATGIFQLTGTADGATKNTETMTLVELARYTKKFSDALISHGLIGPT